MADIKRAGLPVVGLIFLALGVFKFLQGDSWIVWMLLAFLLGGFSVFGQKRGGGDGS
jgi:hypothetical protein